MAKLRKQKPGEHKDQGLLDSDRPPCAIVRHEKLCLKIDLPGHRLHGYAELKVVAPTKGVVGLHAQGLNIQRVLYDGVPTQYEVLHAFDPDSVNSANYTSSIQKLPVSATEAADTGYSEYFKALEKELAPELLIFVPEPCVTSQEHHDTVQNVFKAESNGVGASEKIGLDPTLDASKEGVLAQAEERVKLVHVDYWLEKPPSGGHFWGNLFHTTNQLRRARCWFPCVDLDFQRCSYEMEFTVDSEYIVVSCGKLLYRVISKEGSHLMTHVYNLDIPVAARFISLVVAPLAVHVDASISHFCIPARALHLQCTVGFFTSVFSFYEDYLGASFPFGSYSHVFVDSELMVTSSSVGAAMTILSSHLLIDEKIIDQTMDTRIKLAHALAQQWFGVYISPESPTDEWLLEGLSVFLTDMFIKRHFGNNEAYYRRLKANEAVCKADVEGSPPLSCSSSILGTQRYGVLGHIYSWKSVAIVQMLEKQMGPDAFRKILQRVILRAQDPVRKLRTLSSKEFRHFANRLGNLERPFLKEFFPRWVEFPGCPILRMGFEYSKRRNMVELAVYRSSTASSEKVMESNGDGSAERPKGTDIGWPGMMSIRVHEIDGMYDHPSLPMAGDSCQLLEIHCHSKLAGRRIQRLKKGNRADGAEDSELLAAADARQSLESPLLWLRADPQMEYLADIQLQQPEQMWINQLEKDKDVAAQLQAIAALSSLPNISFAVLNALNSCLTDPKIFYRVRIEAAFALAMTAEEANGWAGLSHLLAFYKGLRFDPDIGLPRPNDFRDLSEYFVLEVIPEAIANVRSADGKSPPEAIEFILQLLKNNDNSGNHLSDVFWMATVIKSVGSLEFSQQSLGALSRILKRLDRFLQYDRIMPSYNHLLTISCLQTLARLALKFSAVLPLDHIEKILLPFKDPETTHWKVRGVVLQALLELEIHMKGVDAGMDLAFELVNTDPSLRVQNKIFSYIVRVSTLLGDLKESVEKTTLFRLVLFLQSKRAFNNAVLRHHAFCILQVLAGRPATLFRVGMSDISMESVAKEAVSVEVPTVAEEPKGNTTSIKVRLVQPPETPTEQIQVAPVEQVQSSAEQVRASAPEQIRLRLKNVGSQNLKDVAPTVSSTSSGKQESDRRVTVLKLRLKPTLSAQENVIEDTRNEGHGVCPVQSSSISVDMGVKKELHATESPSSIKLGGHGNVFVKEESEGTGNVELQKGLSTSNEKSASTNGEVRKRHKSVSLNDFAVKEKTITSEVPGERIGSGMGASVSEQQNDVSDSHGETLQEQQVIESALQHHIAKVEESDSTEFHMREADDGTAHKQKKKKRNDEEGKNGGKKRERDRDKHGEKRHDKHNDPEYRERKRLKKERKRQQQLLQEQQRQQQQLEQNPQRLPQSLEENAPTVPTTAVAGTAVLQPRPSLGSSETVVRLKIKRL